MIVCGWCEHPTASRDSCSHCGHEDPARPWVQRALEPPTRSDFDVADRKRRLAAARRQLESSGQKATNAAIAELLGVDTRTIGRWMSE